MAPKKHEFEHDVKLDVETGGRQGVKAVFEEVLQEEMTEHLNAGYRELTRRRGGAGIEREWTVIGHQIQATDRQIDRLVYELYGLTEEEIELVEEATIR